MPYAAQTRVPISRTKTDIVVQIYRPDHLRGFGTLHQHAPAVRFYRGFRYRDPSPTNIHVGQPEAHDFASPHAGVDQKV